MYCLYTKPVFDIIQRFGLLYHTYLYVAIEEKYYFTDKLSDIENCESEGKLWTERNTLKLNDKTDFIVFKSKHNTNSFAGTNVQVGGTAFAVSSKSMGNI